MNAAGLVYYLLDANRIEQRVKIGWTTNLGQRLDALRSQTYARQQPLVLALEEGAEPTERDRHRQFADLRLHGEWFRYTAPLVDHIRELPNPYAFVNDQPTLWAFARGWQGFQGWAKHYEPEPEPLVAAIEF